MAEKIPKEYLNPKLMVVGDSLAQGCRSLTVTKELCAQSYGALLAEAQGWGFTPPQHPQPVVVDVEEVIRKSNDLLTFTGIFKRIDKNIKAWRSTLSAPPAGTRLCWDNLAIAGCNIAEFNLQTGASWRKQLEEKLAEYDRASGFKKLGIAAKMHFPINGTYTLNPTQHPDFDHLTQLGWAFARKPQCLIVHFGHNDGLYPVGAFGQVSNLLAAKAAYLNTVKQVLAAPDAIGRLVLVLLPKVSCVANLMPQGQRLPGSAYYESYEAKFPFTEAISGKDLKAMDEQIKEINGEARVLVGKSKNSGRVTIVDTYKIFGEFDFKNTGNPNALIRPTNKVVVDNRYLKGRRLPKTPGVSIEQPKYEFEHGGFQSIDGMHPSAVGYAVFADQMALAMNLPRDPAVAAAQLKRSLANETLITKFPSALPPFQNLLNLVKQLADLMSDDSAGEAATEQAGKNKPAAQATLGALHNCFCRRGK